MLPTDIKDLVTAFALSVIFVIGIFLAGKAGYLDVESVGLNEIKLNDDNDLFALNYLKTNVGYLKIKELIVESEFDDEKFENLKDETEEIMDFYSVSSYDVKINYPDEEKRIMNREVLDYSEIKFFNEDGKIIVVQIGTRFFEGPGGYRI